MKNIAADHLNRFRTLAIKAGARCNEPEYMAALYLLSAPVLASRVEGHVEYRQIRFSKLAGVAEPWGGGEKALVKLAAALFNSCWRADLNEVFGALDSHNRELALVALRIRYGSVSKEFIQELVFLI